MAILSNHGFPDSNQQSDNEWGKKVQHGSLQDEKYCGEKFRVAQVAFSLSEPIWGNITTQARESL